MRIYIVGILFFIFLSCHQSDIKKDMIKFDQAFLPVCHLVRQGDLINASIKLKNLESNWEKISTRYQEQEMTDDWQEAFRRVDDWFYSLHQAIDHDEQLWAAAQLEHIRYELMDFRKRYKIPYYLDQVYSFQVALDIVNETVQDDVLCWHTWDEFEQQVKEASLAWTAVLSSKPEFDLFEFNKQNRLDFQIRSKKVSETLGIFKQVVASANREQLQLRAENTELAFQEFLKLFGDYSISNTQIAQKN